MQNPFSPPKKVFETSADLEHPSLQGLDGAEAVLDRFKLEPLLVARRRLLDNRDYFLDK